MRNLEVSHAYAECFWETIKICDEYESQDISAIIPEIFMDSLIIRGEYELDSLEQTLEVLSARTSLLKLKKHITDDNGSYSKKEHLRYMIAYIRRFIKSKGQNRARELS